MADGSLKDKVLGRLIVQKVNLTNAQIKALRATPATLVPAPKNGRLQFEFARLKLNYAGTNAFTETADNLAVRYTDGSGAIVSQAIETTGFIDQTANTETNALPKIDAIVTTANSVGKPLVLHNTGDGEIAGNAGADNTMKIWVGYRILA